MIDLINHSKCYSRYDNIIEFTSQSLSEKYDQCPQEDINERLKWIKFIGK